MFRTLQVPLKTRNLIIKERMPLLHHSLKILATLNNDKIYIFEYYSEHHDNRKVADLSINIPNSKHVFKYINF